MQKISKDLQKRSKAYRAEMYQKLFSEQPSVKKFVTARKVLLWCLRILYLANFICVVTTMVLTSDFSQMGAETIRLLVGLFILWVAGRTYQGGLCLWLLVLGNLFLAGSYIELFQQITSMFWLIHPAWIIMYFVQLTFVVLLIPTAIFLSLPSSRRHVELTSVVEKAYVNMIMAEMPQEY